MMMIKNQADKTHIVFLSSDTGGGHRSAAEAVIEAIELEFGDSISTELVDILLNFAPRPFNRLPSLYPKMVRVPRAWGLGYHLSNGNRRSRLLTASAWPYVKKSLRKIPERHPSNLIVSVHPLANDLVLRALDPSSPPFITVVTDLVSTHALWFHRRADLCIVPTETAKMRALRYGLRSEKVSVVGLPVADRFCHPTGDPVHIKTRLGWPVNRPLILLVGGGEGMGPIEGTARAIANACPVASLVIITGRNKVLKERLSAQDWPIPTFIYGFVREMPDFMRAADILVTKAGPGTISEALIAGLPMVLYCRLPGQEDGNVTHIVSNGAGVWSHQPDRIVSAIVNWLNNPESYSDAVAACRRLARPDAARKTAHILAQHARYAYQSGG